MCVFKKTYFQLMKIISKDDSNDNDGSGSSNDNSAKDYGVSYSNHHEICDDKDDNHDDNSDNNNQIMNARITLHIGREDF